MRYLSLFSGLGGAELAFAPLGWECVAVSEIDPAACRVLSYRYPSIPNLGDITAVTEEQITALGKIDLVIFGFPCQDLSVAGKRAGLKDKDGENTRSGLFFDAMRIVRWSGARWAVAENVPGLFSSEEGRDFATVVGEMAGVRVDVPDGGWSNSGFLASATGIVEWAVLDAQFFRIPQRRRRVFLVRDIGNWTNRQPILLIPESLSGHPAPRREKGQRVAGTIKGGSGERGWPDPSDGSGGGLVDVAGTLGGGSGERGWQQHDGAGAFVPIAHTLGTRNTKGTDERGDGSSNLQPVWPAEVASTLDAHFGDKWGLEDQHINSGASHFVPAVVGTMACNTGPNGHDAGNFQSNQGVDSGYVIPVAYGFSGESDGSTVRNASDMARTITNRHGDPGFVAYKTNAAGQVDPQGDLSAALTSNTDPCTQILAFDTTQVTSKTNRSNPQVGDPCHTLAKGADAPAIAFRTNQTSAQGPIHSIEVTDSLAQDHPPAVGFIHPRQLRNSQSSNQVGIKPDADISDALTSEGPGATMTGMQVRRLTPVECERLQGIPDNHLNVLYKGKPLADGPKYRLCGNSFAVPCVAWIGKRIQMVEDMK
jgi:DNA (cytosine-5)-methyltransferase 1